VSFLELDLCRIEFLQQGRSQVLIYGSTLHDEVAASSKAFAKIRSDAAST
jgi:hypothetical protein